MDLPSNEEVKSASSIFDDFEEVYLNDDPPDPPAKWVYPPMYKKSQTEGILYWRIGFDGGSDELVTEHGYDTTSGGQIGKLQVDRLKIYTNNLHKNIKTKAIQDASYAYNSKYKEGYSDESGNSIDLPLSQLANKYPLAGQTGRNSLKKIDFDRGISIQPKLDGIRARSWRINDQIKVYSREFNEHPWLVSIRQELNILFNELPPGVGIDGELYSHDISFQILTSAVKTYKTKHPLNEDLKYYMFDLIILRTDTKTRYDILSTAYLNATRKLTLQHLVLLSNSIIHNESDVKLYHDAYVNQYGYEGAILRKTLGAIGSAYQAKSQKDIEGTWYKPGRNNNLLKVKAFIDEEGTVMDIVEGEGREAGLAIIRIKDDRGNVLDVRPRGSFEKRKRWLEQKSKYIGLRYTFRYFDLSSYGVPRFPVGVSFRNYE